MTNPPFTPAIATDRKGKPCDLSVLQSVRSKEARANGRETCCSREEWGSRKHLRLQPSRHLACVQWIAVPISVTGDDHGGGIGHALPNLMIGRVLREGGEIVRVIHGTEFLFPDVGVVEEVVPQHVQHRNHADHSAEQIRPLR